MFHKCFKGFEKFLNFLVDGPKPYCPEPFVDSDVESESDREEESLEPESLHDIAPMDVDGGGGDTRPVPKTKVCWMIEGGLTQ